MSVCVRVCQGGCLALLSAKTLPELVWDTAKAAIAAPQRLLQLGCWGCCATCAQLLVGHTDRNTPRAHNHPCCLAGPDLLSP
jgi:hypothetical protein